MRSKILFFVPFIAISFLSAKCVEDDIPKQYEANTRKDSNDASSGESDLNDEDTQADDINDSEILSQRNDGATVIDDIGVIDRIARSAVNSYLVEDDKERTDSEGDNSSYYDSRYDSESESTEVDLGFTEQIESKQEYDDFDDIFSDYDEYHQTTESDKEDASVRSSTPDFESRRTNIVSHIDSRDGESKNAEQDISLERKEESRAGYFPPESSSEDYSKNTHGEQEDNVPFEDYGNRRQMNSIDAASAESRLGEPEMDIPELLPTMPTRPQSSTGFTKHDSYPKYSTEPIMTNLNLRAIYDLIYNPLYTRIAPEMPVPNQNLNNFFRQYSPIVSSDYASASRKSVSYNNIQANNINPYSFIPYSSMQPETMYLPKSFVKLATATNFGQPIYIPFSDYSNVYKPYDNSFSQFEFNPYSISGF